MSEKLLYLASPHAHQDPEVRKQRHDAVVQYAALLMERGFFVFCPIAHTHYIALEMASDKVFEFDYWREYDYLMLSKCDELVILKLEGWTVSKGIKSEVVWAKKHGMPIHYVLDNINMNRLYGKFAKPPKFIKSRGK